MDQAITNETLDEIANMNACTVSLIARELLDRRISSTCSELGVATERRAAQLYEELLRVREERDELRRILEHIQSRLSV